MYEVIYYSLTGNTRKLAEAIAGELGVSATAVKASPGLSDGSLVFLGAGLYGPLKGWRLKPFIESTDLDGRRVALFGTSGEGRGKELVALRELVEARGADVVGSFFCSGQFLFAVNRGHPTAEDLEGARRFAREMAAL